MAQDVTYVVADRICRGPNDSDAEWTERVRRFMDGGAFCKACGIDLAKRAQASGTSLDPVACYCGQACADNDNRDNPHD